MSPPYGAAFFAVALGLATSGTAFANPTSLTLSATAALEASADRHISEAAAPSESATAPFTLSPQVRHELQSLEAAAMPTDGADLAMWSDGAAVRPAHRVAAATGTDPIHRFARGIVSRTSTIAMSLTRSAMRFIGTPYVFGGTSPSGFDCSGYTQHVFAMLGIALPRTADAQFFAGHPTTGGMTTGDLVFFQTYEPGPSHVGIYVGAGRFIHSSSHGVMISRLADSYWRSRYLGAKRVVAIR